MAAQAMKLTFGVRPICEPRGRCAAAILCQRCGKCVGHCSCVSTSRDSNGWTWNAKKREWIEPK